MSEDASTTQLRIRIDSALKNEIDAAANRSLRSVNAEYTHRLKASFELATQVISLRSELEEADARMIELKAELEEARDELARKSHNDADRQKLQSDPNILGGRLDNLTQGLRDLRGAVSDAARLDSEVQQLQVLMEKDAARMQERLTYPFANIEPVLTGTHTLSLNLVRVIDARLSAVVRLALAFARSGAGVDALVIEGIIERDHALLQENRYLGVDKASTIK